MLDTEQAESDLTSVKTARTAHSSATLRMALPTALIGGLAISAVGPRALEPLMLPFDATWRALPQAPWFTGVDVLFTGALLAGGSDGIHWIAAPYRDRTDKNRSTRN